MAKSLDQSEAVTGARQSSKRRVVVTGMGAVTPIGLTMSSVWNAVVEGIVAAGPVRAFDASGFPCQIAYEVDGFKLDSSALLPGELQILSAASRYGINATVEALQAAGLPSAHVDPDRTAVCVGVGMTSPDVRWYHREFSRDAVSESGLSESVRNMPFVLTKLCERLANARGGTTTVHTACASSGQSLGEAWEMIACGEADVVLTGGADSMISPFYFAGFCLLGALSKRNADPKTASRPFDENRDGFVLGEGACMLVFEELEHALARGANILAEVSGYGITESAYRITDLHPEGVGPIEAMQMALQEASIEPHQVGYINAHGTSTHLNDKIESLAIRKVFGDAPVRVSSTKSMTGHMISAAGAIEFALCVEALRKQALPPSVNVFQQDPACEILLTPRTVSDAQLEYALSNSVGFGGSNTALIARRWRGP